MKDHTGLPVRVVCKYGLTTSPYFTDGKTYDGKYTSVGRAIEILDDRGNPRIVIADGGHCPHFHWAGRHQIGGSFIMANDQPSPV